VCVYVSVCLSVWILTDIKTQVAQIITAIHTHTHTHTHIYIYVVKTLTGIVVRRREHKVEQKYRLI